MTTTVTVQAPGYPGKKVVVMVCDAGKDEADWRTHTVLEQGQSCVVVVATDVQNVCVVEMTDEQFEDFNEHEAPAVDGDDDVED